MPRPFLTARWTNLAIVSYAVPAAVLAPYIPVGPAGAPIELDTTLPGGDGKSAYVSLVAFQFQRCRVLGVPWPGHTDFPEINLRFYVRCAGQRGVVFIREFVPRPAIAWIARKVYNEPYTAAPVSGRITQDTRTITAEYAVRFAAGSDPTRAREHTLSVTGRKPVSRPASSAPEHWFKEHNWGFGMLPPRRPDQPPRGRAYEVIHPIWGIYPVERHSIDFDFAALYGPDWGFLSGSRPVSVVLAAGSEVAVFPARGQMSVRWGIRAEPGRA